MPASPSSSPRPALLALTPLGQLRAGRLPSRLLRLFVGLTFFGVAMGAFVRAGLGVAPWDVLHLGLSRHIPLSLGTIIIVVGLLVLLAWIPLRQWPGLGTIANTIWIGVSADLTLWLLPEIHGLALQIAVIAAALVVNGLGGALYIGSQFGAGPRDGLMTGLHLRTGWSLRVIRTGIEVTVLAIGWLLGGTVGLGTVGLGTVAYALLIGPSTQFFLRWTVVDLSPPAASDPTAADRDTAPCPGGTAPGSTENG
ncbi:YitT family protein [Arthrobacter sp. JSM 101049]|uniref:membrane protein YczE n=1 Tax=Arthrobacter sp. JSM 101049 TaxID=929097 RepID=UPI0035636C06